MIRKYCVFCTKMEQLDVIRHNPRKCKSVDCQCFCRDYFLSSGDLANKEKEETEWLNKQLIQSFDCWINRPDKESHNQLENVEEENLSHFKGRRDRTN